MKLLISSRRAAATLTLIAAAIFSGCNNQTAELKNNTHSPNNTNTAPTPTSTTSEREDTAQKTSCADGNPIKGINSKRLGKIALTPQSPVYDKSAPFRCFPDTAAAQKAGYTVPK